MIVILTGAAVAGAVGAWVARRDRVAAEAHADELVNRLVIHPARGLPCGAGLLCEGESLAGMPSSPRVIEGEVVAESHSATTSSGQASSGKACHGQLTRHEDRSMTCGGGLDECWPGITRYQHTGRPVDCRTHSHGCGQCLSVPGGAS